jgi:class 3 adenylate cyclase
MRNLIPAIDSFPPETEAEFRHDYFVKSLLVNRWAFMAGGLMIAAFGLVDFFAIPVSLPQVMVLRVLCVSTAFGLFALTYHSDYERWMKPASALAAYLVGAFFIGMVLVTDEMELGHSYYIFGTMLVIFFIYTISRLRLRYAAAAGWAIFLTGQIALVLPSVFEEPTQRFAFILANAFIFFANLMGMLAAAYSEQAFRRDFYQQRQIAAEHERAERLLLNILPAPVAERLKHNEQVADHFEQASVLFADIVDFTPLSASSTPAQIVDLLNDVFSAFDTLTEKYGLEKIKTIGDCYMVVSGIPQPRPDHALALAEMALEMHGAIAHLRPLCLRIGIHSGPMMAGVVGLKKFIYDLWGDTVNVASRMESNGLPGRIRVTEATYDLLKDRFTLSDRGEIPIKGKGLMRVYLLDGRRV